MKSTADIATDDMSITKFDMKLEAVVIPVADVDRAKEFYRGLGWRLDADFPFEHGFRVVQLTPPGSAASIQFGSKITAAAPGSASGLYLIVSDLQGARDTLAGLGVETSAVFHPGAPGAQFARDGADRDDGPAPDHASYSSGSLHSATPTATNGCCRRSPSDFPVALTPPRPHSPPRPIWPTRCVARRLRTANTRNGRAASTT